MERGVPRGTGTEIGLEVKGAGLLYDFMNFEIQGARIEKLIRNPAVVIVSMLSE